MPLKSTRGVVISEKSLNESDKVLTIFSEDGKFKAVANGVKNPKSALSAGCRLFAWSEFQYYPGKNFARISQAHLIDPFYALSSDLTVMSYASYIADLINNFYDDYQMDRIVLKHLVYYYYYLNKNPKRVFLLTLAFQIKMLLAMGISPDVKSILNLDQGIPIYFSIRDSVFSNQKQYSGFSYRLTKEEIDILLELYRLPINKINQLDLTKFNESNLIRLIEIFNHYIENHLEKSLKSFEILKEISQPV